jgi:hypothetical protein
VPEVESNEGNASLPEPSPVIPEIPTFDLAENILAEHRRTAAGRRKAPNHIQAEPEIRPERAAVRVHVIEPPSQPSQDMLELHRVVAEIVARDIERLCRRPGSPPCEQPSGRGGNW